MVDEFGLKANQMMELVDPEKLLKRHVRHRPARAEHWVEVCAQGI